MSTPSTGSRRRSRSRWPWRRSSASTGFGATSLPISTRCGGKSRGCIRSSTPPPTGSPSGTSTASSSPEAWPAETRWCSARSCGCCATPTAARRASSTCTSRTSTSSTGSRSTSSRPPPWSSTPTTNATSSAGSTPRRLSSGSSARSGWGRSVSGSRAARASSRCSTPSSRTPPTTGSPARSWACRTAAGSTCSPTSSASPTTRSSRTSRACPTPRRCRGPATSSTTWARPASSRAGPARGSRVGGTIHIVINNQIGFTTTPEAARSGIYATDVGKIVQAPIFHVNGDDPEACVRVARLAYAYRQRFHREVVIDLVSYRRYGHNEGDDPSYTQPLMYAKIDQRRSVRKLFTESLVKRGQLTLEEAEQALDDYQKRLQQALDETRQSSPPANLKAAEPAPAVGVLPRVETGVDRAVLDRIYDTLSGWPDDFNVHPKLAKQIEARDKMVRGDGEVDWATAEALAFGSLLLEGTDIRVAGQDTRRGTFSQRHSVLVDHTSGREWAPLAHLAPDQGKFWIYDSLLSEYAAL